MIKDIANILKAKLQPLPFVDRLAGVVQIARSQETVEGKLIQTRFPISCDVNGEDCAEGGQRLIDLIPNSEKKSVFYFEDIGGAQFIDRTRNDLNFQANLRLVGWLNMKELGKNQCSVTSLIVANVIRALTQGKKTFNEDPFTRITIEINQQVLNNANIFSDYTYKETETQYLMYPYDFFALDLRVFFSINENCMDTFILEPADECNDI